MRNEDLILEAKKASLKAYAPYSKFHVGCALKLKSGQIIHGCNVENASYGLCMCAERNAISTMITNGEFEIEMVAAVDKRGECTAALRCVQRIYDAAQKFIRYKSSC